MLFLVMDCILEILFSSYGISLSFNQSFCYKSTKVIFDYLFQSSYMPVLNSIATGFSGILH